MFSAVVNRCGVEATHMDGGVERQRTQAETVAGWTPTGLGTYGAKSPRSRSFFHLFFCVIPFILLCCHCCCRARGSGGDAKYTGAPGDTAELSASLEKRRRNFPGGPVMRIVRLHCAGQGFRLWSQN